VTPSWLPVLALLACGPNETPPATTPDPYQPGTPALTCVPDLDGKIESHELEAVTDAAAQYLVSPAQQERSVNVAGRVDGDGKQLWDWSRDDETDQAATLRASALTGKWYAASFPDGQFVAPVDLAGTTEGIYRKDDTALWLLGVASREENGSGGKTLLPYTAPVALYRFPIEHGRSWVSIGEVRNGTFAGLPYAGRDTYEVDVDGAGTLHLPHLSFTQAMRVRMRVTVAPAVGITVQKRQVSFLFECFGEVARATSRAAETEADFTTAAEVRRLGLFQE